MSEEELIETLRAFQENRVENLEENARNLFYAIMKIADERDEYKNIIKEVREYILQHCEIIRFENENIDKVGKVDGTPLLEILDKEAN